MEPVENFGRLKRALQRPLESAEVSDGLRLEVLVAVYKGPVPRVPTIEDYKAGCKQTLELLE